jgi:hypothetical protein
MFTMSTTPRVDRRRSPLRALLVAALLLGSLTWLAACGGSQASEGDGSDAPAAQGGSGAGDPNADAGRVRLAQCLREHGVDVPDDADQGGQPPAGLDMQRVQSLLQGECREVAAGAFGDVAGGDQDAFRDAYAVYAQCMRENGADLPDLPTDGSLPDVGAIDRDAPSFKQARQACASKLPQGVPGGGE